MRDALPRSHGRLGANVVVLAASLTLGACSTMPAGPEDPEIVDLSGEWVLNYELSDSPSEVLKINDSGNGALGILQTLGGSIGMYGISANDVIGMLPAGSSQEEEPPAYHPNVTDARLVLSVLQTDEEFEVKYDLAGTEIYKTGHTLRIDDELITSSWEDDAYVVERQSENEMPFKEIFELSPDGQQLRWTIVVENAKGREVEITRVYDVLPINPSAGSPSGQSS